MMWYRLELAYTFIVAHLCNFVKHIRFENAYIYIQQG